MAVHTAGDTSTPTYGYNTTTYTEVGPNSNFVTTGTYYITKLWAHFGTASGGSATAHILLVGSGGTIYDPGAMTVNGEAWYSQAITPYAVSSGGAMGVGWWIGVEQHFGIHNYGSFKAGSPSSPSNMGGFTVPGSPLVQGLGGWYFEYIDPAAISGTSGAAQSGQTISITGSGFTGGNVYSVTFNGIASPSFSIVSDTQINAVVPSGNATGTLQVNTDHGSPTTSFTVAAPTISSLSPSTAVAGQTVTVTGYGFTDGSVSGVTFNGIAASSYSVASNTTLTAVVPHGYTTGNLVVSTNHGSASKAFTEGPPSITSVSPSTAGVGQSVTITGSGFTDGSVTSVTFTGVAATSYTVNSNTQITATVPAGATTGNITVNTNHGSASYSFNVSGAWVADGTGAVQNSTIFAFDGSALQQCTVLVYDGATWQQAD